LVFFFFLSFLMCSHKIPKFPMCSPTYSQIAPHFVPYALHNIVLFQQPLSLGGPILGLICFYVWNKYFYNAGPNLQSFTTFLWWTNQKRLITPKNKIKSQLTNMDDTNKNKVSRCHPHIGLKAQDTIF
jgi:hypothetical protein